MNTYQINGETKLRTWKLFTRSWVEWSPVAFSPTTRKINAVNKRESVMIATIFQKEKALHVTNRKSIQNYSDTLNNNHTCNLVGLPYLVGICIR